MIKRLLTHFAKLSAIAPDPRAPRARRRRRNYLLRYHPRNSAHPHRLRRYC